MDREAGSTTLPHDVQVDGLGPTGTAVAALLASAGVGRLALTDPRPVLPEQLGHGLVSADVGRPRAEALAQRLGDRGVTAVAQRHGGRGGVYGQLGSISNRAVLGKDSASVREERGVRATRDGLSSTELLRLAYIDTVTNHAIQERGTQGNAAILRLHEEVARSEGRNWAPTTGQVG